MSATTGGGNATATNTGNNTALGVNANTASGGNATATNSGSNAGGVHATTFSSGDAAATNTGSNAGGITAVASGGPGNATASNSGTNTNGINAVASGPGNATASNRGTNTNGIEAVTGAGGPGNAAASNSGINTGVGGITAVSGGPGNATASNFGTNTGVGGITAVSNGPGNATVTNSGTNTTGLSAVANGNGAATVTNSGTSTGATFVVANGNGNAILNNSGTITGGVVQVFANGGGSEVATNSGTINNFGGVALQFGGGPDTLNLLAGSNITGAINLAGANDTVNFLSGNHNLTFNTLAGATVHGPDPFVVIGNRAVAIDPTPFGLADKNLMDFTRAVSGILGTLGGGAPGPNGPISSAFAPSDTIAARADEAFAGIAALAYASPNAAVFKAPTIVDAYGRSAWARGFGGQRVEDADGAVLRSRTVFMGGAVGFDFVARPELRLGVFAGGGQSQLATDANVSRTDTDTVFGGVYGRWSFTSFGAPSFLDFALQGGGSRNTSSRTVNNNTIAGGIEIATANYNSSYVSPEIKYGVNLPLWSEFTLTPSIGLRYLTGFFDGYTETGTTAPLTVGSRTISDFEERGELKLTRATRLGPDLLLTSVYLGALGVERAGDTTVNTVVLGAGLPFVTPGRNAVAGVVGGGGLEWRTREGVSFFGAAEAIGFNDQSTVVSARGGLRVGW